MPSTRAIQLLVVALLFSQLVSATHMVSHLHGAGMLSNEWGHERAEASEPSAFFELADEETLETSCVIFHVYAANQCLADSAQLSLIVWNKFVVEPIPLLLPVLIARSASPISIRGPPLFS